MFGIMRGIDRPDWTEATAAYDKIARRYDDIPNENRINAFMRQVSLGTLTSTFRPGQRVLELGCGTGEEALALATAGMVVVATDPSEQMIAIAREKAARLGQTGRVQFLCLPARELDKVTQTVGGLFDGAYASFSLGYEPDLSAVAKPLHRCLKPHAIFLATVPSRVCLVELLIALLAFRPGLAGNRLKPWHGHKVGAHKVPIRTYTRSSLALAMFPLFQLERVEALPAVVPPPYMNRVYCKMEGLANQLERLDERVRKLPPFRALGDHLLVRFRHIGSTDR